MSATLAVLDFALFQLAWLACIAEAAAGRPVTGIVAIGAFVVLRLARSDQRRKDLLLMTLAAVLGFAWDTALLRAGLVRYASAGPLPAVAPMWIVALWVQLAAVLGGPLRWLQGRPALAAVLGAVGGPASYAAAQRLGACTLHDGVALAALAAGWAVFMPLLAETSRAVAVARWRLGR